MIFLLSITIPAWCFFYLDLNLVHLIIGGTACGFLWATNRYAYLNFEGANENPLVQIAMGAGMFGTIFSIIAIAVNILKQS